LNRRTGWRVRRRGHFGDFGHHGWIVNGRASFFVNVTGPLSMDVEDTQFLSFNHNRFTQHDLETPILLRFENGPFYRRCLFPYSDSDTDPVPLFNTCGIGPFDLLNPSGGVEIRFRPA